MFIVAISKKIFHSQKHVILRTDYWNAKIINIWDVDYIHWHTQCICSCVIAHLCVISRDLVTWLMCIFTKMKFRAKFVNHLVWKCVCCVTEISIHDYTKLRNKLRIYLFYGFWVSNYRNNSRHKYIDCLVHRRFSFNHSVHRAWKKSCMHFM